MPIPFPASFGNHCPVSIQCSLEVEVIPRCSLPAHHASQSQHMTFVSVDPDDKWEEFYSTEKSTWRSNRETSRQGTFPQLVPLQLPCLFPCWIHFWHLPSFSFPEKFYDSITLYSIQDWIIKLLTGDLMNSQDYMPTISKRNILRKLIAKCT